MDHWIDVSMPLQQGMPVWPGDRPFETQENLRIERGEQCNLTEIALSAHTGTHMDAPWHFIPDGRRIHELEPETFMGHVLVLNMTDRDLITAKDLEEKELAQRIIFKTRHSLEPESAVLTSPRVGLSLDAAEYLAQQRPRLIGVDALSIEGEGVDGPAVHRAILGSGTAIVEGLRLSEIEGGFYECVVLPLLLIGADGAPCRAFLRKV